MHLLEDPDLGHSVIYYDGKKVGEEKVEEEEEKSLAPGGIWTLNLKMTRQVL